MKIISGGQTGVDRAALDVALSLGIECGGWCPGDRSAEDGRIPEHYPVRELPGAGPNERTRQNVIDSDGTVIFHSGSLHGGTALTLACCRELAKPFLLIDAAQTSTAGAAEQLDDFARENNLRALNVAGPRASEWPGGYEFASAALRAFLRPEISFIVPAHNEERELPATLAALRQAGDESQCRYEIIVVDDASTDATARIACGYGARVLPVNRRHIAAVRNAGARAARGEVLFFVDADTRIKPVHVTAALETLAAGYAGGGARIAFDDHIPGWGRLFARVLCAMYFCNNVGAGGFLFTTRANFEEIGGFDESYYAGEELFFSIALKRLGPFRLLPDPMLTSGRKLRMHSAWRVLSGTAVILLCGTWGLRSRKRLDFWYDGKREGTPA